MSSRKPRKSASAAQSASRYAICIIGNSHVAALKLAWTNRAPKVASDVTVTFFSAQNRLMRHLVRDGRALVAQDGEFADKFAYTSGGKTQIDVDDYDAFVLVGASFSVDVPELMEFGGTATSRKWGPVAPLLSRGCFEAIVEAELDQSQLIKTLRMVRAITGSQPVVIVAAPCISERVLSEQRLEEDPRLRDPAFLNEYWQMGRNAAGRVAERHGCALIWQREDTLALPGFTKEKYGINGARFEMKGLKAPEFDARHGNEDYGMLMLNAIFARLDAISGGRVLPRRAKK